MMNNEEEEDENASLIAGNSRLIHSTSSTSLTLTTSTTKLNKLRIFVLISILFTLPILIYINSLLTQSFEQDHKQHASTAHIDPNNIEFDSILTPDIQYSIHNLSVLPKLHESTDNQPDNLDSTAHYITILGKYADGTKVRYEFCSFTHVCVSPYHIHFSLSNYAQHLYHSYLFPSCHLRKMREVHEICRCFHEYYQPALLPYPANVTDLEKSKARDWVFAEFKRRMRDFTDKDVTELETKVKVYQPDLNEFQSMTFHSSNTSSSSSSLKPESTIFEQASKWFATTDRSQSNTQTDHVTS